MHKVIEGQDKFIICLYLASVWLGTIHKCRYYVSKRTGWMGSMNESFADVHYCINWVMQKRSKDLLTHYMYGSFWNFDNCGSLFVRFIIVSLCPPTPDIFFHRPYFVTRWYLRSQKILMRLDPRNDGMFICFGIFSMCLMSCSRKIDVFLGLRYIIQPEGKLLRFECAQAMQVMSSSKPLNLDW